MMQGMYMSKKKLIEQDRAAVDLLLDRNTEGLYMGGLADSGVFVKSVDVQPQRVRSVKHILNLLKELPTSEPPDDLAGKTLRRIYAGGAEASAILRPAGSNRPGDQRPA
jgi:hypothetical protein